MDDVWVCNLTNNTVRVARGAGPWAPYPLGGPWAAREVRG
jgi:hypothetical protein